ncbi:MAG TPA: zinc ribbon domain-containing protein, partial [Polyangiaceae bacterium]
VAASARQCRYCRAELATVRCHHCYAMNGATSLHCGGCGRELGLEPVGGEDERACPTCAKPLFAFRGTGGVLLDCTACGGQFVEHGLLASLLESREVAGLAVERRVRRAALGLGAVRYVPCPSCRALMNRKNFGGASGVVVDVCSTHGTWFDEGELPRVLAFVESGGLSLARERIRERERDADRARAERQSVPMASPALSERLTFSKDMEAIADATMELFDWLARGVNERWGRGPTNP